MIITFEHFESAIIRSSTGRGSYRIRRHKDAFPGEDRWTCTCPSYRNRSRRTLGFTCKHLAPFKILENLCESMEISPAGFEMGPRGSMGEEVSAYADVTAPGGQKPGPAYSEERSNVRYQSG